MHRRLQQLAGLPVDDPKQVLTIGMLRNKEPRNGKHTDIKAPPLHPEELEAGYLFKEEDMQKNDETSTKEEWARAMREGTHNGQTALPD